MGALAGAGPAACMSAPSRSPRPAGSSGTRSAHAAAIVKAGSLATGSGMSDDLAMQFDNGTRGVLIDRVPEASLAVVAFGGIKASAAGMPPFEFFKVLDGLPVTRVFVRDVRQAWYSLGVEGVSDDIPQTARHLSDVLLEEGIAGTIFTGASAGGYAALLFGTLLRADEVHAFSPQTFLSRRLRLRHRDFRWRRRVTSMRRRVGSRAVYPDLQGVIADDRRASGRPWAHVYYGTKEKADVIHARRLEGIAGIELHEFERGHRLVRHLRESGELQAILTSAIQRQAARNP